jgi:hypothetical protein
MTHPKRPRDPNQLANLAACVRRDRTVDTSLRSSRAGHAMPESRPHYEAARMHNAARAEYDRQAALV